MNENYLNMCISEDLKYELIRKLKPYNAIDVIREIEKIPTCSTETKRKKGDGRGRSEYQLWISECMKKNRERYVGKPFGAAGIVMKDCAIQWKKKKGE